MVRKDQAGSLHRIEQISSLPSEHLESPSLIGFDLRDLDDNGGQLGNLRVTRCRQSLELLAHEGNWDGYAVPAYVERDFRHYLECGILAYGFARAYWLGRAKRAESPAKEIL